jgi:hypothetical protein
MWDLIGDAAGACSHYEHWQDWQAEDNFFSLISGSVILPPLSELNQPGTS